MSTLTNELGTAQPTLTRPFVAPNSDPSMDEALARVRRIAVLDEATRRAASHVRRPAVAS